MPDSSNSISTGRIEEYVFGPVNPTYAAVFRIAFAVMLALAFWPEGRSLISTFSEIPGIADLYDRIFMKTPYWMLVLVLLTLWGVGWWPRLLGLSLVGLLLPLEFLVGVEQSRQILLFALLAFSLLRSDARSSLWWRADGFRPVSAGPMWPIRLIQLQLSVTYGVNALAKTTPEFLSGQVLIEMSQLLPNFLVDLSDGYLHVGQIALPVWLAACSAVATEYASAVGFWFRRLRILTALVGVLFHLILKLIVTIGWLDWACMFLYLAFLLPFDRTRQE